MGMFDDVECELPLPDGKPSPKDGFQSKDMECELSKYVLREDSRFVRRRPPAGFDGVEPDGPDEIIDFTGPLVFYTYEDSAPRIYEAIIEAGIVLSIEAHDRFNWEVIE